MKTKSISYNPFRFHIRCCFLCRTKSQLRMDWKESTSDMELRSSSARPHRRFAQYYLLTLKWALQWYYNKTHPFGFGL